MYIHEHDNWPHFRWDNDKIAIALDKACRALGMLYGRLSNLGFDDKLRAIAENLTLDVVQSSEIEGIHLNSEDVRSSIARRLGIDSIKQNDSSSHYIDGVVNVTDVVLLTNKILRGTAAQIDPNIADLTNDGLVNVSDVVALTTYCLKHK